MGNHVGVPGALEMRYHVQRDRRRLQNQPLGKGGYATVWPCTCQKTSLLFAVKSCDISKNSINRGVVQNEVRWLTELKHPLVVTLVEVIHEPEHAHLILEYCHQGCLADLLDDTKRWKVLSKTTACNWLKSMFTVVAFLHERRVCHRDVKPHNFLLVPPGSGNGVHDIANSDLKLADFGVAIETGPDPLRDVQGSGAFIAPEIRRLPDGKGYGLPVDVFALGITAFWLLGGRHPYMDSSDIETQVAFRKEELMRGEVPDLPMTVGPLSGWNARSTAKSAYALIVECLLPNPDQRVTADAALRGSLFTGAEDGKEPWDSRGEKLVPHGRGWIREGEVQSRSLSKVFAVKWWDPFRACQVPAVNANQEI
eukprot:gnl/TRDRNA2_/TRDRNA2_38557_c0_seq2.p1 gnl/TRDRNA2_/TRDRNA2_38557_c0~~gnl/TRDRNA2_/TRDRNA2_38557_c0_seq2.p1  ORF type:complete len:367 (-),score=41.00 gnl/TRDRNA2_/TRDRNA2_38557_c0_seq2:38-1138(-)